MDEETKDLLKSLQGLQKLCNILFESKNITSSHRVNNLNPSDVINRYETFDKLIQSLVSQIISFVSVSISAATSNESDTISMKRLYDEPMAAALTLAVNETIGSTSNGCSFHIGLIPQPFLTNLTDWCKDYSNQVKPQMNDNFRQMCVIVMFTMIFIISLFGNMFVVWASIRERRTRSTVNVFIGNLAVSDLLMTIFNIPMAASRLIRPDWIFGAIFCQFNAFLQSVFIYVSTLSMTYIAIDRYQAISRPMSEKLAPPHTIISIIWLMAGIFSIPFGISYEYSESKVPWQTTPAGLCNYTPDDIQRRWIGVATFFLQFAIPLVLMVVLYSRIAITMSKDPIGASTREQQQNIRSRAKKNTIIMLVLVAGVFTACWMPFNVYYLLDDFKSAPDDLTWRIGVTWIAFSSVCYNPFIYCWLHNKVQTVIKSIVSKMYRSWCHCCTGGHNHYHYPHRDERGRVYYTCNGQIVYEDVDQVMNIQSRSVDKASGMCTPFCTATAPINSDNGHRFTNLSHDNTNNVNNGVLVLSQLISSSVDNYNDNHNLTNNSNNNCSNGKCECFVDEIRSLTHSTFTGCSCKRCNSPVFNDTFTNVACSSVNHYKNRDDNSMTNCCGRSGSSSISKHLNDTNSVASSSGNNCSSNNPCSLDSSRRSLVHSKKYICTKSSKLHDIHKNHLYCHKSKRTPNISSC